MYEVEKIIVICDWMLWIAYFENGYISTQSVLIVLPLHFYHKPHPWISLFSSKLYFLCLVFSQS